jgi:DNA-binding NarL/FixJ family response regulator
MSESVIRVLIADDQLLMRDGLASLLNIQPGIDVVGMAENGQEAITAVADLLPDVVLMDVRMPVMDGIEATAEIHRRFPEIKVLMLTTFDDEAYVTGALRAGAFGYVLKNTPALDLAQAIQMAQRGMVQLAPSAADKVAKMIGGARTPGKEMGTDNPLTNLTEREIEVLRLVVQGASNREIAGELVITEGTVKSHISNILNRLEARDRTQAAVIAVKHGLT